MRFFLGGGGTYSGILSHSQQSRAIRRFANKFFPSRQNGWECLNSFFSWVLHYSFAIGYNTELSNSVLTTKGFSEKLTQLFLVVQFKMVLFTVKGCFNDLLYNYVSSVTMDSAAEKFSFPKYVSSYWKNVLLRTLDGFWTLLISETTSRFSTY